MATSRELLSVSGLKKAFSNANELKTVLEDVNIGLSAADSLAIVGPSGCGKTTFLLIIAGLLSATQGSICLEGEEVRGPSRKIALVLQHYGLFPWKTVAANVSLGARLQKIHIADQELVSLKKELGIEDLDRLYPEQLSGGQRQRVALARALLLKPSLLLLDEPFAAIDTITRERLQNHLLSIFGLRNFSFIIVTHNIEEAVFLGRKILVLGGREAGVKAVLENAGMGNADYRNKPAFFELSLQLRRVLEEIE